MHREPPASLSYSPVHTLPSSFLISERLHRCCSTPPMEPESHRMKSLVSLRKSSDCPCGLSSADEGDAALKSSPLDAARTHVLGAG